MRSKISVARTHVAALRAALLSPSVDELAAGGIAGCVGGLVEAAQCLGVVEERLRAGDAAHHDELRRELGALRNDLRGVRALIEQGAAFYLGLAKLLGAATAGYMPSGAAAPLNASGALSLKG